MDVYTSLAGELSRATTLRYSTSFGSASKLYSASVRPHIFNIYGWVRIADEIVDAYRGEDARTLLQEFTRDTQRAMETGFSPNPIIHSFAQTARTFGIDDTLIEPFMQSMAVDADPPASFGQREFDDYIYGSAQVVGLMCLRVFVGGDEAAFARLRPGAEALGAAFQKVNFLRDFADDTKSLGRYYFPGVKNGTLDEKSKQVIITDIRRDFEHAKPALKELPNNSRAAVTVAARYYLALLRKLEHTPAAVISTRRVRVSNWQKARIFAAAGIIKLPVGRR